MKLVENTKQTRREQEDAVLNRILIWFFGALIIELVLLLINRFAPGILLVRGLTALVPAVAVLALVYYLYQRDFFAITLITAGGILSLQLYRRMLYSHPFRLKAGFVFAFCCLAAAVIVLVLLQRKGGVLVLKGRSVQLLPKDASYLPVYLTCVINAAVLAVTLAVGLTAAYYLLFVLAAWLFISAVYYTVRLI